MKIIASIMLLLLTLPTIYFGTEKEIPKKESSLKKEPSSNLKENKQKSNMREIFDSNGYELIPSSGFALLFFYAKNNNQSLKMKKILHQIQLKEKMPFYTIEILNNQTLSHTFKIKNAPAIVIIQDRHIISSLQGFTDNMKNLSELIQADISKNTIISPSKQTIS